MKDGGTVGGWCCSSRDRDLRGLKSLCLWMHLSLYTYKIKLNSSLIWGHFTVYYPPLSDRAPLSFPRTTPVATPSPVMATARMIAAASWSHGTKLTNHWFSPSSLSSLPVRIFGRQWGFQSLPRWFVSFCVFLALAQMLASKREWGIELSCRIHRPTGVQVLSNRNTLHEHNNKDWNRHQMWRPSSDN